MSEQKVAGLAKAVREQTDKAEEYDLDNYSEEAAGELMTACFAQPHPAGAPLRCSFVIGGGKSIRGRYDPNLYRGIAAALKAIGFDEDSGASLGSSAAFKSQHDTGRNVKVVHVFPPLAHAPDGQHGDAAGEGAAVPLAADSPLYRLIEAENVETFGVLCEEGGVRTYAQLSRLLKNLAPYIALLKRVDEKMMGGQPLSPAEEAWAAITTTDSLAAKAAHVQMGMKGLVERGELSAAEKAQLLRTTAPKLEALEIELAAARSEGKEKRVEKLAQQRDALIAARTSAEGSRPPNRALPPPAAAEVAKLWAQVLAVRAIEASAKQANQLLSLEQARQVGQLPELLARIDAIAEGARGWFESDEELGARVALAKGAGAGAHKKAADRQAARTSQSAGWTTSGSTARSLGAAKKTATKPGGGKGGAFAALAGDD
ncbi:hypothetical protein KFE25_012955 [Diacronema lutheri]|uniref:Uncharacterized protein n=1 Tax=Diacronema lutheri TaxID=2081491 RepID=A0A8J5X919_DIALT|nr:hypothetical protein KFE25_012955 [Diacronema lutheri]